MILLTATLNCSMFHSGAVKTQPFLTQNSLAVFYFGYFFTIFGFLIFLAAVKARFWVPINLACLIKSFSFLLHLAFGYLLKELDFLSGRILNASLNYQMSHSCQSSSLRIKFALIIVSLSSDSLTYSFISFSLAMVPKAWQYVTSFSQKSWILPALFCVTVGNDIID